MKNIIHLRHMLLRCALALAVAGITLLPSSSLAQVKGGERLIKLNRLDTIEAIQAVKPGDTIVMSCPKCKETWVTVVQPPAKGDQRDTATIQRHECPGCKTTLVTEGVGKQAKSVVKHVCTMCGSTEAFCCVMKKGATSTTGMDQK